MNDLKSTFKSSLSLKPKKGDFLFSGFGCDTKIDLIATEDNDIDKPKSLLYFVKTVAIKYINISICQHLVDAQIKYPEDLVAMDKETLISLPNMGEKSANKIYESIHTSLAKIDTLVLMISLNLLGRNIGLNRLQEVSNHLSFNYLVNNLANIDSRTLEEVDGFSSKLANQLADGLVKVNDYLNKSPKLNYYFQEAKKRDIITNSNVPNTILSTKYNHLNVVFTGFRDTELEEIIKNGGGNVTTTINKSVK